MGVLAEGPALEEPSNEIGPRCSAHAQAGKECRGLFHSLIGNICAAFTFFIFILNIIVRLNIIAIVRAIQVLTVKRDAHGFSGILSNAQTLALLSIKLPFFFVFWFCEK